MKLVLIVPEHKHYEDLNFEPYVISKWECIKKMPSSNVKSTISLQ